jgi:hypothetical protein
MGPLKQRPNRKSSMNTAAVTIAMATNPCTSVAVVMNERSSCDLGKHQGVAGVRGMGETTSKSCNRTRRGRRLTGQRQIKITPLPLASLVATRRFSFSNRLLNVHSQKGSQSQPSNKIGLTHMHRTCPLPFNQYTVFLCSNSKRHLTLASPHTREPFFSPSL